MSSDPNDVVKVAVGETIDIELYKQALTDAGIEAHVLGETLDSSLGTAIINSVELWVQSSNAERAREVIREVEEDRGSYGAGEEEG